MGPRRILLQHLLKPSSIIFPLCCALALPAPAQAPPRALPADPVLAPDAAEGFFSRAKNLHDAAQAAADLENRRQLFDRAAQLFSEYLAGFPDHPNAEAAWWYLGNSFYQSGRIDDAKRCFSTLINRFEKGQWATLAAYTLAADHYNKGEYAFAAPMFERYAANAAKPEEKARGDYLAGNSHRLNGRDREAGAAFRRVIENPAGANFAPQAQVALGHLAVKAGKLEDGLARFEEVVAKPYLPKVRGEAALHAALVATKLGRTEVADRYLGMVLRGEGMEEFRADAQTALMGNHFEKKEYRKVIEVFRSGGVKSTGAREAARLMIAARAHMRLKQPSDALGLFREVEKLVPPEGDLAFEASYYRLLCFYQIEGRHVPDQVDAFLQLYRKSRPEDPRVHTALMMKAESLLAAKDVQAAAKAYSEVNAAFVGANNRAGLFYQRGWCLSEAGDHQGAIRSLSEFIAKYPDDPRIAAALAKRAKSYAESAEPGKAVADYDRLVAEGMPEDLASHAWLESARLRRAEKNIPDMIARYKGLLGKVDHLSDNLQAEANYYIGWGLVKTNAANEAVPFLEKARTLRPDAYRSHAGVLLALGYFAAQDAPKLAAEIRLAIEGGYDGELPAQALQWSGMQAYNSGDHAFAAKCLGLVASTEEPRATPKEVWRYLAKSRFETGDAAGALVAADHTLAVEDNPAWKADGLLDRGRALLALDRADEARKAADEALALRPQGRTSGGLRILLGDLDLKAGDFKQAAGSYLVVVQFIDDKELKPLALAKLVEALTRQGDSAEAENYRRQLASEFPGWKP